MPDPNDPTPDNRQPVILGGPNSTFGAVDPADLFKGLTEDNRDMWAAQVRDEEAGDQARDPTAEDNGSS